MTSTTADLTASEIAGLDEAMHRLDDGVRRLRAERDALRRERDALARRLAAAEARETIVRKRAQLFVLTLFAKLRSAAPEGS
jgi:septal ring factor EnvC (AmiA/AmiB activator)